MKATKDTSEKVITECQKFIKILILISLKNSLKNAIRKRIFPTFDNIITANILERWEKRGFTPMQKKMEHSRKKQTEGEEVEDILF